MLFQCQGEVHVSNVDVSSARRRDRDRPSLPKRTVRKHRTHVNVTAWQMQYETSIVLHYHNTVSLVDVWCILILLRFLSAYSLFLSPYGTSFSPLAATFFHRQTDKILRVLEKDQHFPTKRLKMFGARPPRKAKNPQDV